MEIKLEKNVVNIYKEGREAPIYSFRKSELADIDGDKISAWIGHLLKKTWIENDTLYQLAVLIQKEFPENEIDWLETFFIVEKKAYLGHVKKIKLLNSSEKKSEFNNLMETINIGIEEHNSSINNRVSEVVKMNLDKYGLK